MNTGYCGPRYGHGTLSPYGETNSPTLGSYYPDGLAVLPVWASMDSTVGHAAPDVCLVPLPVLRPAAAGETAASSERQELGTSRRTFVAKTQTAAQTAMIECACGCGVLLTPRDNKNRPRRFLHGHWTRTPEGQLKVTGAPHPSQRGKWRKPSDHWRTCRYRARTTTPHDACAWLSIGGCDGPIEVAHVDGRYTNNAPENLLALCASHHRLLDHGWIDPKAPVMPLFYVSDGKRRYLKKTR